MKKFLIVILIVAAVVVTAIFLRRDNTSENTNTNSISASSENGNVQANITPTPVTDPNVKTFTMEDVQKHGPETWDTGDSSLPCWMVIHDKVYEIPDSFTETHPGGHVIYDGCGTDATTLFETRPQGSGTPHSADARKILEKYYIGDLKK